MPGRLSRPASGHVDSERIEFSPTLDVYETPDEFVLFVTAPGVKEGDMQVEIADGTITISGEREPLIEGENVTGTTLADWAATASSPCSYTVPTPIDENKVKAVYRNGISGGSRLPKAESAKPKTVKVQRSR